MSQAESIRVIQIALGKLAKQGLWNKVPSGEKGAIVIEVGLLQTKCIWHPVSWFYQLLSDHKLGTAESEWAIAVAAQIRVDPQQVVVGRVDSQSEDWKIFSIERPRRAPGTVQELLQMQRKS
jgi:hypothetical protein